MDVLPKQNIILTQLLLHFEVRTQAFSATWKTQTQHSSLKSWEEQQQNYLKSAVQFIKCSWSVHFPSGQNPQKENTWSKAGILEPTYLVLEHPIPPGKRLPNNAKMESTKCGAAATW